MIPTLQTNPAWISDLLPALDGAGRPVITTWIAEPVKGWGRVAREFSRQTGGQWIPHRNGVTWNRGGRGEDRIIRILTPDAWEKTLGAQECCRQLGVSPGGTVGGCARALLKWIGPAQEFRDAAELAAKKLRDYEDTPDANRDEDDPGGWGYHDCYPGEYDCCTLYDVQSCYWNLFVRLPALRLTVGHRRAGLYWHRNRPEETSKLSDLSIVVSQHKPLRNTIVGTMWGTTVPGLSFCRGKEIHTPPRPGPFAPAAMLIVRTAYELCAEAAAETQSVLSTVDSVVVESGRPVPRAWDRVGLPTRVVATGDGDICRYGIYKVGHKSTAYYRMGYRMRERVLRPEPLEWQVNREWL